MSENLVYKALTVLAIEKTLLKIGKPIYLTTISMLDEKFHCSISDCYERPEYLSEILKKIFGDCYTAIVNEIRSELEEYLHKAQVARFLEVINQ